MQIDEPSRSQIRTDKRIHSQHTSHRQYNEPYLYESFPLADATRGSSWDSSRVPICNGEIERELPTEFLVQLGRYCRKFKCSGPHPWYNLLCTHFPLFIASL